MDSRCLRFLVFGLAPFSLAACADPGPKLGQASPAAPLVGADLGGSSRMPQIAGLVGEGEFSGGSQSPTMHAAGGAMRDDAANPDPAAMRHGSMPGMDHGSMPGMSHGAADRGEAVRPAGPEAARAPAGGGRIAHSGHARVRGVGTVNAVDAAGRKINVTHAPIPALGWPSMTMDFSVASAVDLNAVQAGTRVDFEMEQGQDGMYVIQSIAPAGGSRR